MIALPDVLRVVDGVIGTSDGSDVVAYLQDHLAALEVGPDEPVVLLPRRRIAALLKELQRFRESMTPKLPGKNSAEDRLPCVLRVADGVLCMADGSSAQAYLQSRLCQAGVAAGEPMSLITRVLFIELVGEVEDYRRGETLLHDERFTLAA